MMRTFLVINTEGLLDKVADISMPQFMLMKKPNGKFVSYRDGKPVAIIADQNCMTGLTQMGGAESFCKDHGKNYEDVLAAKADMAEVAHIQTQMDEIYAHTRKELMAKGVKLDAVPTDITSDARATVAVGAPQQGVTIV